MDKIKSPKTGYMITINGKTYNQLIKEGYIGGKVKSPKTNRLISIQGNTYKKLYNEGYFNKITGLPEIDKEILLHLSSEDLSNVNVNVYMKNLMDESFWCQWLARHYFKSNTDCKSIAKLLNTKNMDDIYDIALTKGYEPLVNYLLLNKLVDPLSYKIPHYTLEPIYTATRYNHLNIVQLLLSYGVDPSTALYHAVESKRINIVDYLLKNYEHEQDYLDECLQTATRHSDLDIMTLLIQYGANPEKAIISAIHSDDMNILKYILSFNPSIPNDAIAIALGLRKYEMLRLLLDLPNVENNKLEALVLPMIQDQALYYEVKHKW